MFADTHVHPVMKYVHNERDNLWKSFAGQLRLLALLNNLIGIPAFSQSDMRRLAMGNFQIIFCALHPPEQQIMFTPHSGPLGAAVDEVAEQIISIPKRVIHACRHATYNHFDQLNKELNLLINKQILSRKLKIKGKKRYCKFEIAKNFSEVKAIIDFNASQDAEFKIAVVLTIEGLHSLGRGHVIFNNNANPHDVSDEEFMLRLDRVKGITNADGHGWPQSPLIINITHAFDNGICGHAQALSETMRKGLFDYAEEFAGPRRGLNKSLSTFGNKVIKRMLNMDEKPAGRRIIPDIKHMSTATRRDYYAIIDTQNKIHPDDIIPVIMSHAAVNGKTSINENNYDPIDSEQEYKMEAHPIDKIETCFNPLSINLYDDEIIRIHETKGLIGIIMDQRVLAGGKKVDLLRKYINNNHDHGNPYEYMSDKEAWFCLVYDQIQYIVKRVIDSDTNVVKQKIWDCLCIGSDFDGQIDPINAFKKATDFGDWRTQLKKRLNKSEANEIKLGLSTEEILEKVCYQNVYGFLARNF